MVLKQSNPYLKSAKTRRAALRISAQTSSAIEGIRAPFKKDRLAAAPESDQAFIAHWKRHLAATAR